ncbi:MAG TPA: tRNA (adenosine(37)-N6)-dimethylallyltransferase MiaA [Candidatus Paceibacterota bacterium]|mgnify:CR=1 FL=1|nr:tRNA (adenosine(37)-N6)-dimethylallyltransferase MiaA [Candidatus Paceibacterota bacterium]
MPLKPKVIAIVGPTASGKTSLAIEIAKEFNGEVISADSRQVYRGLDIGSGKVTKEEMDGVPHHLIDIVDPDYRYSAADFLRDATTAILEITSRGKVPIIAGGTFFYLDLLRGKMQAAAVKPNLELQAELEKLSTAELIVKLQEADPKRADTVDQHNRRRLIRSLEIISVLGQVPESTVQPSDYEWLILGIDIEREILNKRIKMRLEDRLQNGLKEEVVTLLASGLDPQRLDDFGLEYRYLKRNLKMELDYDEMVLQLFAKLRQFAKRQNTWLKRDKEIIWKKFPVSIIDIQSEVEGFLE